MSIRWCLSQKLHIFSCRNEFGTELAFIQFDHAWFYFQHAEQNNARPLWFLSPDPTYFLYQNLQFIWTDFIY